jgi:hypothetical protein
MHCLFHLKYMEQFNFISLLLLLLLFFQFYLKEKKEVEISENLMTKKN